MRKILGNVMVAATLASIAGCDYAKVVSGTLPCSQWTEDQRTQPGSVNARTEIAFAQGFFPAFYESAQKASGNRGAVLNFPDANTTLLASMNAYCQQYPDATITQAANDVMVDAMKLRD